MLGLRLPLVRDDTEGAGVEAFVPNAFIRIGTDGSIVFTMPYVEMGQGTYTAIPMLIAEELEVALDQIRLEHAPPNPKLYGNAGRGAGDRQFERGAFVLEAAARGKRHRQDDVDCCGRKASR